jgi:threonylcarbamoyladenosine tRNA methylthiotransferase CDKAL1
MRVFVESHGCSTNSADGAVLAGCLARAGYELVDSGSSADVIVLNTCAVKGPTENRMIDIAKRVPHEKKLIVAGCLPLINLERLQKEVRFNGVVGPAAGQRIVEVVKQVSKGNKVIAVDKTLDSLPSLSLPRVSSSPAKSVIPISYGCLGSCAYCCVVLARRILRSYHIHDIVQRVKEDLARGFIEFWATSQDAACYGRDRGTNLSVLLHALCSIDGNFRVRVGMMTPNNISDMLQELVQSFEDDRIFKFIHLPVQSGDDEVLKRMRRFYRVDDFRKVAKAFRARFPDISLATDVICGFPGESEEAFQHTLHLVEEVRPDIVNVSKFFPRPKTPAAQMQKDFLSSSEVKHRSGIASALAKKIALENNRRWIGWAGDILVDEVGKVPGSWVGRNFAYKPVAVKSPAKLIGKLVPVEVVKAFPTYLKGKVVR